MKSIAKTVQEACRERQPTKSTIERKWQNNKTSSQKERTKKRNKIIKRHLTEVDKTTNRAKSLTSVEHMTIRTSINSWIGLLSNNLLVVDYVSDNGQEGVIELLQKSQKSKISRILSS